MTLDQIDDILRNKGYPSREEMADFPLGKLLLALDSSAWLSSGRNVELYEKENPNSRDLGKDEQDLSVEELEERLREQERILSTEKITEVFRHHSIYVIKASVMLTTNAYFRILEQSDIWSAEPFASYGQFLQSKKTDSLLGTADSYFRKFLRFAALYHDIGKVINRERHGLLGRHLLETLGDAETTEIRNLLRYDGEDYFPLLIELVGNHDLFGTLCTGEASRPVLLDVLRIKDPARVLGCQATLNIADIYSTLRAKNLQMDLRIFQTVLEDWKIMADCIKDEKQREPVLFQTGMEKTVLFYAQQRAYAAERIQRMLVSAIFMITEIKGMWGTLADQHAIEEVLDRIEHKLDRESEQVTVQELKWLAAKVARKTSRNVLSGCIERIAASLPADRELVDALQEIRNECSVTQDELRSWAKRITAEIVADALRKRLGPRLVDFCDCFALVCKFNYALRFIQPLVTAWINEKVAFLRVQDRLDDPKQVFEMIDVREIATIIVEIFSRIMENYQDLTFQKGQRQRRIGIELLGVTRSNTILNRIIELLLSERMAEGVNWVVDEATAWYFI
ncbi:MAG: HD domain-containing protein [Chitinispirillaceae bacterium]|jgi:hypothetical protein